MRTLFLLAFLLPSLFFQKHTEVKPALSGPPAFFYDTARAVVFKMIRVDSGSFQMGVESGNLLSQPAQQVSLSGFYLMETEVSQELWKAVMGSNPATFSTCANCPIESVNYAEVQSFCRALSSKTGRTYRLPTEAEWEFAAKGGNKSKSSTYAGSQRIEEVAWHEANSQKKTQPIASLAPNELGFYDMSGNVFELCSDYFDFYQAGPKHNPKGSEKVGKHVARGGAWHTRQDYCSVFYREGVSESTKGIGLGIRLVCESYEP